MKTLLKISICLNLVLAGGLIFMLHQKPAADPAPQVVVETRPAMTAETAAAPQTTVQSVPEPFRWSQLEAKDYHVYVKNLRAIGCPEPTVRAIVSADVHAAYQVRIETLEKKISDYVASSWTNQIAAVGTETALKSELQQIPDEEAAEIEELLGSKPAPVPAVAQNAGPSKGSKKQPSAPDRPIAAPLAFQKVDLTALNLNPRQLQSIADMKQRFLNDIGGLNQDPNDPAYREHWKQVQPENDSLLRGMLGRQLYLDYQALATSQSAQQP
jgi:hypothetical protein